LFGAYLASIISNIKEFDNIIPEMSTNAYDRFTNSPTVNLQYITCHDGFTLWDKINLIIPGTFENKLEAYRQALIMLFTVQGRKLILGGTELLYTKPADDTGEEIKKAISSQHVIDYFDLKPSRNAFHGNSYKTTDYVNGIR
jgi:pullulanase